MPELVSRAAPPAALPLAAIAASGLGLAYLWRTDPHQPGHLLPFCPFHRLTGLQCPACGGTRLVYDLLHGHPAAAWHDNALLLLVMPYALWWTARWVLAGLRGRSYQIELPAGAVPVVLLVAVAWAVLRNTALSG